MGGEDKDAMLGKAAKFDVKMCDFQDLSPMMVAKVDFGMIATA